MKKNRSNTSSVLIVLIMVIDDDLYIRSTLSLSSFQRLLWRKGIRINKRFIKVLALEGNKKSTRNSTL